MGEGLVLVHLRPGPVAQACVSRVYLRCVVTGVPHRRTCSTIPNKRLPKPTNSEEGTTRS